MHGRHTWRGVGGLDLGLVKVVKTPNTHTSTHIFHETFREPLAHVCTPQDSKYQYLGHCFRFKPQKYDDDDDDDGMVERICWNWVKFCAADGLAVT